MYQNNSRIKQKKAILFLLPVILLVHAALSINYVQHQQITFDEPGYINYSKRWLKGKPKRVEEVDDSKTPLTAVVWLPRVVKQVFNPGYKANDWGLEDLQNGRYPMLLYLWAIVLYIWLWCRQLYGANGYWIPIILLLTDPLVMAYSVLINSDLISAFVLLATCYHFYRYSNNGTWKQLLLTSLFTGLALATKQGFLFLPFILLAIYLLRKFLLKQKISLNKSWWLKAGTYLLVTWLVLNAMFFFSNTFQPLGEYTFISNSLQQLQASLSFLSSFPVLLPEPYLQSVDLLQYHAEIGPGYITNPFAGVYVNGRYSVDGIWNYYLLVALVKLPVGLLLMLAATIVLFVIKWKRKSFAQRYIFLLLPLLVYFLLMSFINPFQIGIRHALMFFPLAFIGIGYWNTHLTKWKKIIFVLLISINVVSVATYYPDIIPYTNELLTDKKKVHRYLYDTSIDYGQADSSFRTFIKANPGYTFAPKEAAPGKFIVPARFVMDKWDPLTIQYNWLQQYKPIGHYRYVYLLYDVKE